MRITDINFEAASELGLKDIKMSRLGKVVVLAGPNGAGKTRFIHKLQHDLSKKMNIAEIKHTEKTSIDLKSIIHDLTSNLSNLEEQGYTQESTQFKHTLERIEKTQNQLTELKEKLLFQNIRIKTSPEQAESHSLVSFTTNSASILADSHNMSKSGILSSSETISQLGIKNAAGAAIPTIQLIQDQWFNATHHLSRETAERKETIIQKYERLIEFISVFLETKLDRDLNGDATIFGFRIGSAELSEGQKLLLQFCITLYAQEGDLSNTIICIDEPEKHLHPSALLNIIDKLTSALPNGQLWIATHSLNLLSHVPASSIWYMKDGAISYSGNKPERILKGLLGDEEAIAKMSNFMTLPAQMAGNQFAFECLFPPLTLETGSDDPQTTQIISTIKDINDDNQQIKVLDFGAGKGRLLSTINEFELNTELKASDWLDYVAFDLPSDDEGTCRGHIKETYEDDKDRYFNCDQKLKESLTKCSVDVVVLCNVFHEIDPKDWFDLFSEHGAIRYLLKDTGTLLIVEDQHLPYGEKAYNNGFLVLDKLQFKELFEVDNYTHTEKKDGRLRAHRIPASSLGNINSETRLAAIRNLKSTAKDKVKAIRGEDNPDFRTGQQHAFWSQQLTNATLALEELGG